MRLFKKKEKKFYVISEWFVEAIRRELVSEGFTDD